MCNLLLTFSYKVFHNTVELYHSFVSIYKDWSLDNIFNRNILHIGIFNMFSYNI